MKKLKYLLSLIFILPLMILFAGCNDSEPKVEELSANNIKIEHESYNYTGEKIEPKITVTSNDVVVPEKSNYHIIYGENTEVGQGSIEVIALEGSKYLTGSATVYFQITRITSHVSTFEDLQQKAKVNMSTIILDDDISVTNSEKLNIIADESNLDVIIDLNNHTLSVPIVVSNFNETNYRLNTDFESYRFNNYYIYSINLTIQNGNLTLNSSDESNIKVSGNSSLLLNLNNVRCSSDKVCLSTDKRCYGANIIADECSFTTNNETEGAPLVIESHYSLTFNYCNFYGYSCAKIYKGSIVFNDGCDAMAVGTVVIALEASEPTQFIEKNSNECDIDISINNGMYRSISESDSVIIEQSDGSLGKLPNISIIVYGAQFRINKISNDINDYFKFDEKGQTGVVAVFNSCEILDAGDVENKTISDYPPSED